MPVLSSFISHFSSIFLSHSCHISENNKLTPWSTVLEKLRVERYISKQVIKNNIVLCNISETLYRQNNPPKHASTVINNLKYQ
jgi:hypothetical protein